MCNGDSPFSRSRRTSSRTSCSFNSVRRLINSRCRTSWLIARPLYSFEEPSLIPNPYSRREVQTIRGTSETPKTHRLVIEIEKRVLQAKRRGRRLYTQQCSVFLVQQSGPDYQQPFFDIRFPGTAEQTVKRSHVYLCLDNGPHGVVNQVFFVREDRGIVPE